MGLTFRGVGFKALGVVSRTSRASLQFLFALVYLRTLYTACRPWQQSHERS